MNKKTKCKSKCLNLPKEKCKKGCTYTLKKKCKLSNKFMMDSNNHCKVFLKKQFFKKNQTFKKNIIKKNQNIINKYGVSNNSEITNKSYSPDINKYLVKSRNSEKFDIFNSIMSCINKSNKIISNYFYKPKVMLEDGNCVDYKSNAAQELFLDNLSKHNVIDIHKIIAPKQKYNNCWFNTGIMMNYVSDKGRKFHKYFRQYMITGKMIDFKDDKMRAPLFMLNISIESILNGNILSKYLDTNNIIRKIYREIPENFKYHKYIYNEKKNGNPYRYTISLLNYLGKNKLSGNFIKDDEFNYIEKTIINHDVLWLEIFENNSNIQKLKEFKSKNGNLYKLDSMLLTNNIGNHFCCFITINNKEYMYDGASTPNIVEFNWKDYINNDQDITLDNKNIIWNMRKGYQVLNFYRS